MKWMVILGLLGFACTNAAYAMPTHTHQVEAVKPFYQALNAGSDVDKLVKQSTASEWISCSGTNVSTCKSRSDVIAGIKGLHQAIPNLKWSIKQTLVSGNHVIVQGEASGTPVGDFFGVPHSGKSFLTMSIDIHTLGRGGKIVKSVHVEDWVGALQQLR